MWLCPYLLFITFTILSFVLGSNSTLICSCQNSLTNHLCFSSHSKPTFSPELILGSGVQNKAKGTWGLGWKEKGWWWKGGMPYTFYFNCTFSNSSNSSMLVQVLWAALREWLEGIPSLFGQGGLDPAGHSTNYMLTTAALGIIAGWAV